MILSPDFDKRAPFIGGTSLTTSCCPASTIQCNWPFHPTCCPEGTLCSTFGDSCCPGCMVPFL